MHDVHSGLLHLSRPLDVSPLVEPGLELHQADRLLGPLGRVISAGISAELSEVRYTVVLIATTFGSLAPARTNASTLDVNES